MTGRHWRRHEPRRPLSFSPWLATLIREAEAGGPDHLVRVAVVDRLRRVPELLKLDAGVEVPGAVRRSAAERHGHDPRDAEVPEFVVDEVRERGGPLVQLVVVADAEADLDRDRDARVGAAEARAHAELEVLPRVRAAVCLVPVVGVELEGRDHPRMERGFTERRAVVAAE